MIALDLEFLGLFLTTLVTVVSGLAVLLKPILSLNSNIIKLNQSIEELNKEGLRRDKRLDAHADKIDTLERNVAKHDVEINNLKRGGN